MNSTEQVKTILAEVLNLGPRRSALRGDSPLLGSIPELDSIAVINVITALEEHFGITVADDEISAETFATLDSLSSFVDQKLAA